MYINSITDRQELEFSCIKDINAIKQLIIQFQKHFQKSSNLDHKKRKTDYYPCIFKRSFSCCFYFFKI